jgi:hypothetical protein
VIELIGRSDDDPPIFALRVSGDASAHDVRRWLEDAGEVERVEIHLAPGSHIDSAHIQELSTAAVEVRVVGEGTSGMSGSAST